MTKKSKQANKSGDKKFSYKNRESLDSVFNYLAMLNKGLKNRQVSLGNDDELVDFDLPDNVAFRISAESRKGKGTLNIDLTWDLPAPGGKTLDEKEKNEKKSKKDLKAEKKLAEKKKQQEKAAKRAQEKAEKKAKKEAEANKKTDKKAPAAEKKSAARKKAAAPAKRKPAAKRKAAPRKTPPKVPGT
jgi:amphi-Trp domain-containing protein